MSAFAVKYPGSSWIFARIFKVCNHLLIDNYEKLGAKTCFLVRIRGAKQHEVINQTPPRSFSFHIIKMPINNA